MHRIVTSEWVTKSCGFHEHRRADGAQHRMFLVEWRRIGKRSTIIPNTTLFPRVRRGIAGRPRAYQLVNITMVCMVAAHRRFQYWICVAPAVVKSRFGGYIEFREEGYEFDRLSDRHLCPIRRGGGDIFAL